MATRAEQLRYEQEREKGKKKRDTQAAKEAAKPARKKRVSRVAAKATVALEPRPAKGRPSRKSTRSSANRLKADTNMNLREERAKTSPKNRYRKSTARAARVRGSK